ncbi:MAG: Crp/Fnr family transcriptional regulator [Agriterribacter sp.]
MNNSKNQLLQFLQKTNHIHSAKALEIADHFNEKMLTKGDFQLRENQVCNEYLFLEQGYMRAFAYDVEGADITTDFYSAGQMVFEVSSFFKRNASKENIQALTDCCGWYISYEQLNALFHGLPEFREFGRAVLVNGFASLKNRMLAMITATAEERYSHLLNNNPDIFQYVPLKNIATFLGVTDTSLSRIRKQVAQK